MPNELYRETFLRSHRKFDNSRPTASYKAVTKANEIKTTTREAHNGNVCEKVSSVTGNRLCGKFVRGSEVQVNNVSMEMSFDKMLQSSKKRQRLYVQRNMNREKENLAML